MMQRYSENGTSATQIFKGQQVRKMLLADDLAAREMKRLGREKATNFIDVFARDGIS
jgi:hypothetical protein